jgi:orotidine-5'-phosphate decarboxylase
MTIAHLKEIIRRQRNFLCVGLDSDFDRIPEKLKSHDRPVLSFNKAIIDATKEHCVAYKLNTAFYESRGSEGWKDLEDTIAYIPKDKYVIADAKRGDIGNTADQYAKAFFKHLNADALTVNPYMGMDTLEPFKQYADKSIIALGLTSNRGSEDIEQLCTVKNSPVYFQTMKKCAETIDSDRLMFVVGATHGSMMGAIRDRFPKHFFLVPGVGAQGGSAEEVFKHLSNSDIGILINSSRGIIFASSEGDFSEKAGEKAAELAEWMATKF